MNIKDRKEPGARYAAVLLCRFHFLYSILLAQSRIEVSSILVPVSPITISLHVNGTVIK